MQEQQQQQQQDPGHGACRECGDTADWDGVYCAPCVVQYRRAWLTVVHGVAPRGGMGVAVRRDAARKVADRG